MIRLIPGPIDPKARVLLLDHFSSTDNLPATENNFHELIDLLWLQTKIFLSCYLGSSGKSFSTTTTSPGPWRGLYLYLYYACIYICCCKSITSRS